jgi:pSer/pThr/pTyr-binding forkhead associated (FHA) protein
MAKIIVTFNGQLKEEVNLTAARMSIGRRPSNDLVIDHLTVSGEHAAIETTPHGIFVLDLGSTNGTIVNGQPVKKHLLQDQDRIEVGKYKLRFDLEVPVAKPKPKAESVLATPSGIGALSGMAEVGKIKVLSGRNAGKELILTKPVTTLGTPGVQVIAITRGQDGYSIAHTDGHSSPTLNGEPIDNAPRKLNDQDLIELSGVKMQFLANG